MSFPRDIDRLGSTEFPPFSLHVVVMKGEWRYVVVKPNGRTEHGTATNLDTVYRMFSAEMREWHQKLK